MRRSGRYALIVLWVAGVAAGPSFAQIPEEPDPDTRIETGPVFLYPFGEASIERTDNVFMRSEETEGGVVPGTVEFALGGLAAELPFSHSRARLAYAMGRLDYGLPDTGSNLNHYARADLRLRFGNRTFVNVKDDYQRGVLDIQVFDPGGELTFAGERFEWNAAGVEVGTERWSRKRLAVGATRVTNRVLGERISGLYDTDDRTGRVSAEFSVAPRARLLADMSLRDAVMTRPDDEDTPRKESRGGAAQVGAALRLAPATTVTARAGLAGYRFSGAGEPSDYRAWVGSADLRRESPGSGATFALRLQREVYPALAYQTTGDYYVSRQIRVQASRGTKSPLVLGVAAYYYVNDYPQETAARRDRTGGGQGWVGWRFRKRLEWRAYVERASRDSTYGVYDYSSNVYGMLLRVGG